ncbi:MAG: hypothetical protein SCALA702_37550 [Melioribacteraceae bacterium]|nr:MAG: hypothetical protein SCALA702_37550 [Melioribacteraceae bacterium]
MSNISGIDIAFSYSGTLLIVGLLLFGLLSFFVYKYTIPQTSLWMKIVLGVLRTVALLLILFAIFEPVVSITERKELTPVNVIAVDNSSSIVLGDSLVVKDKLPLFLEELQSSLPNTRLITFGDSINPINSPAQSNFSEKSTNMDQVFSYISDNIQNVASLTLIGDGIVNEGAEPVFSAERTGYPVNTIGIGDTTVPVDISVGNILFNEIIYAGSESQVVVSINNRGFGGEKVKVELHADNELVSSRNVTLSETGLDKVSFEYIPDNSGIKRMYVSVTPLKEENRENNRKIFFTDVRDNKLRLLLITGSPSSDFAFIRQSLNQNENIELNIFARIDGDKVLGGRELENKVDSSDILIFTGYPAKETRTEEIKSVVDKIKSKKIPFLFTLGPGTDFSKLRLLEEILPVELQSYKPGFTEVQPEIVAAGSPLLGSTNQESVQQWGNLPTVQKTNSLFSLKAGTEVISKVKIRGIPDEQILLAAGSLPGKRSIFLSAANIWRWKLLRAQDENEVFENFLNNSMKWLNIPDNKEQVVIKTEKRVYSAGEKVEFSAQVYDDAFNPVENALVEVNISGQANKLSTTLTSQGGGLYSGEVSVSESGFFRFKGNAVRENDLLGEDSGSFSIGEVNPEKENLVMNKILLERLAKVSGGEYYNFNQRSMYLDDITSVVSGENIYASSVSELKLWSEEWLLYIIVILFSIEWFLRKRMGML